MRKAKDREALQAVCFLRGYKPDESPYHWTY
jgi:hypothetical protein